MAGLPIPKKAKRSTQANIASSMTFLIPKRFRKNGISRIQTASQIWEIETSIVLCFTAKVSTNSGAAEKLPRNGVAKPLVICRLTPRNIQKMKNKAIFFCLNSAKAFNPSASTRSTLPSTFLMSQFGKVSEYAASSKLSPPLITN